MSILTDGFGAYEALEGTIKNAKKDLVSVNAINEYMRAQGLNKLVDVYAVHVYP